MGATGEPARRLRLSRFERLAALQAKGSMAGRDQAAKWAHALRCEIAIVRCDSQLLPERGRQIGTKAANTAKKRMREGIHNSTH